MYHIYHISISVRKIITTITIATAHSHIVPE